MSRLSGTLGKKRWSGGPGGEQKDFQSDGIEVDLYSLAAASSWPRPVAKDHFPPSGIFRVERSFLFFKATSHSTIFDILMHPFVKIKDTDVLPVIEGPQLP